MRGIVGGDPGGTRSRALGSNGHAALVIQPPDLPGSDWGQHPPRQTSPEAARPRTCPLRAVLPVSAETLQVAPVGGDGSPPVGVSRTFGPRRTAHRGRFAGRARPRGSPRRCPRGGPCARRRGGGVVQVEQLEPFEPQDASTGPTRLRSRRRDRNRPSRRGRYRNRSRCVRPALPEPRPGWPPASRSSRPPRFRPRPSAQGGRGARPECPRARG